MKASFFLTLCLSMILITAQPAAAQTSSAGLVRFLKACAWGTVIGASVGTITLAFEDRPSEHTVNISRGASLGLYGGIAAGLMQMNPSQQPAVQTDNLWGVVPRFDQRGLAGVDVLGVLARF